MISEKTLKIIGGILLVSGTAIGASMLAMPLSTAAGGFIPTVIALVVVYGFVTISTLYLLEVFMWVKYRKKMKSYASHVSQAEVSTADKDDTVGTDIISMAKETLGPFGKVIAMICYLMLLYSLIAAYFSGTSAWVLKLSNDMFGVNFSPALTIGILAIVFGYIVVLGASFTEKVNNVLAFILFTALAILFFSTVHSVDVAKLDLIRPLATISTLPLLVTAFGYSVVVPTLADYMKDDVKSMRLIIVVGGLIAFVVYFLWELITLGNIPFHGAHGLEALAKHHDNGTGVVAALEHLTGFRWLGESSSVFTICAILTSLLGVSLALSHFLSDATRIPIKGKVKNRWALVCLAYLPPLIWMYFNPTNFSRVLSFAGIFVALLFGIMPAVGAWIVRHRAEKDHLALKYRVGGGRGLIILVILFNVYVIFLEMQQWNL